MALNVHSLLLSHFLLSLSFILVQISFVMSIASTALVLVPLVGQFASFVGSACLSLAFGSIWDARQLMDPAFVIPEGFSVGLIRVTVELAKSHFHLFVADLQFVLFQCFIAPISFFAWPLKKLYGFIKEPCVYVVSELQLIIAESWGHAYAYAIGHAHDVGSTISHYFYEAVERLEIWLDDLCRTVQNSFWAALAPAKRVACKFGAACWAHIDENYQKRIFDDMCDVSERVYEVYEKRHNMITFRFEKLVFSAYHEWLSVVYEVIKQCFLANTGQVFEYRKYLMRSTTAQLGALLNFAINTTGDVFDCGIGLLSSSLQQLCALPNVANGWFCIFFNFMRGDVYDFACYLLASALKQLGFVLELLVGALGALILDLQKHLSAVGKEFMSSSRQKFDELRLAFCRFLSNPTEEEKEENLKEVKSREELMKEIRQIILNQVITPSGSICSERISLNFFVKMGRTWLSKIKIEF